MIVELTMHSLADILSLDHNTIGTLFMSNSNRMYFVESLRDTNGNSHNYVDYENVYCIEGMGIAMDVDRKGQHKKARL